jgi:hypothetical protein
MANNGMSGLVTIASVRAHGVRQLLVYCLGKREGDWSCHHSGKLPIDRFQADEVLSDIERRCRCTVCGWRRPDLRPDYSKQQAVVERRLDDAAAGPEMTRTRSGYSQARIITRKMKKAALAAFLA